MIPMIQWPLRRVTANIDNSYESCETSLKPPPSRYITWDQRWRFPTDRCNQLQIGGGDAITIPLPFNLSIHQREPYTKLETISEPTRLRQTNHHADEAPSRLHSPESRGLHRHLWWCLDGQDDVRSVVMGAPNEAQIRMRSSLPEMSANNNCAIEVHPRRRCFARTNDMRLEDEVPYNQITWWNTPTKRTHGYTPPSRANCTGILVGAPTAEKICEAQLWECRM